MSWGSIIAGAVGGFADGRIKEMDAQDALKRDEAKSARDADRATALEYLRRDLQVQGKRAEMQMAEDQRVGQAKRIDAETDKLYRGSVVAGARKLYGEDKKFEDLADEEVEAFAPGGREKFRTQAAVNTGDIGPKDAATMGQKDEAMQYKALWEQAREEGRNSRADARLEAQASQSDKRLAVMMAAIEARASKGEAKAGAKEALGYLDGVRKTLQTEETNLRQMYKADLDGKSPSQQAAIKAEYEPKLKEIAEKRRDIEEDFGSVRERVGLPARSKTPAPTPSPAPAAPKPAPGASAPSRASQFKVIR